MTRGNPRRFRSRSRVRWRGRCAIGAGSPGSWVHVGDDVVNDCEAAKMHGPFKTVLVAHPGVVPWGQPRVDPARAVTPASDEDEVGSSELVDVRVTSVGEIPGAIAGLYAS